MSSRKIPIQQLCAWLFVGLSAPLAQFAGGSSWLEVLLIGGVCLSACVLAFWAQPEHGGVYRWLCALEILWLVIVLGMFVRWVDGSWAMGNAYPVVPIVLLILAAAASDKGAEKASRVGGILFWLVILVFALVLYAGTREIETESISSETDFRQIELVPVFLIPALLIYIPREGKKLSAKALIGIGAFAVVVSLWVTGGLSSVVAESAEHPLYEWVRGLRLMETAQRFEAVVSVALTMGWFALFAVVLSVVGRMVERIHQGWGRAGVWICAGAAAASTLIENWIPVEAVAIGCAVGWILLPVVSGVLQKKKIEKC